MWRLPHFQIVPSILRFAAGILPALSVLGFFLLLTLVAGRVYCSVICPLGILQDVIARLPRTGKKKNKRKKYKYEAPRNLLRYSILTVTVICTIAGSTAALAWLDPYSNFGKIAENVFGMIYKSLNNLLSAAGISSLYYVSLKSFEIFSFAFSILVLLVVGVMAVMRGRLFCNTICPVGALLALASRFSIFKLMLDPKHCNSCGMCATRCKSQCIDSKNRTLDFSRCVTCYNCIDSCNRNAVGYKFALQAKPKTVARQSSSDNADVNQSKRRFVASTLAVAGAAIAAKSQTSKPQHDHKRKNPISPPGSQSVQHLLSKCTACHLCISQCPTQVLKPAFLQYGLTGIMMPVMDYKASFCNFECTRCSEVCPNGALLKVETEEKRLLQIGRVKFARELCVVYTDETDCGACSEHCPTKAISMVEYKDVLRIPEIDPNICIGCGGCEYICPVRPLVAMQVDGNVKHIAAEKPPEEKKQEVNLDGFGF